MLQGEVYCSEEIHLTRLVLLVEYKLKTEFLKNNLKHEHVGEKKKSEEKKGRYHLKIQCIPKDIFGCNKQDLRVGLQFIV